MVMLFIRYWYWPSGPTIATTWCIDWGWFAVRFWSLVAVLLLLAVPVHAQSATPGGMPPPPGMSLASSAAMRFPQPVRVGDLVGRPVLRPIEAQTLLGRVESIVRDGTGTLLVELELQHWFGLSRRRVAIPVDGTVLVGETVEVVAFTPTDLWRLPLFDASGTTKLGDEDIIRVGLAKPSH